MERRIRKAGAGDLKAIMDVIRAAKGIMRASGNREQWAGAYPGPDVIGDDIAKGSGHVVLDGGATVGYFAFIPSPEPTYARIYGGSWLDDGRPYHVLHRIASLPESRGVLGSILEFCSSTEGTLRIDTHRDNAIMQHLLERHGFTYCGVIHLADGAERLAYQRILPTSGGSVHTPGKVPGR